MNPSLENQSTELVKIAVVQQTCQIDPTINLEITIEKIRSAADQGAKIICLQELFRSRYFCQELNHDHFALAEPIDGPTTKCLLQIAKELHLVIVAAIFEKRAKGVYHNTALVMDVDGSVAGIYRKMHIPDDPYFCEKFYFTPGDLGFDSFVTAYGKIGVCICWDQWFPEAARLTALSGADVIVYPTAIGWLEEDKAGFGENQLNAWQTVMRSHAITNGVFVVAPNRVGVEDHIEFWGSSFVCDPYGEMLAVAGRSDSEILVADCDFGVIDTARVHWPFLRDRRIDAYQGLNHRFGN